MTPIRTLPGALLAGLLWFGLAGPAPAVAAPPAPAGTPSPELVSVVPGHESTCALVTGGTVRCWGEGGYGRLGNGGTFDSVVPVQVAGISTATSVALGWLHACAALADGTVRCWGYGELGELGNGGHANSAIPVTVPGITTATAVAAGEFFTCALLADHSVRCWGRNEYGQLGNGTRTSAALPVPVTGLTDAVAITAGGEHACVLRAGGTTACWGSNGEGQAGASSPAVVTTPLDVAGIEAVSSVSAGAYHSCAVVADGSVLCWGRNDTGQVGGDGNTATPRVVAGLTAALQVDAGTFHTCALLADHTARCWGLNLEGQLGDGTATDSAAPVVVEGLSTAIAIAAGTHTCALLADDTASCWGYNSRGQLGDRTTANRSVPTPVSWEPDSVAPTLAPGEVWIVDGYHAYASKALVAMTWSGADDAGGTGINHYTLQRSRDGGRTWVTTASQTGTTRAVGVPASGTTLYRVRATDWAGTTSAWLVLPALRPRVKQQTSSRITYRGPWTTAWAKPYLGGSTRTTRTAGASATFTVTARAVAYVATESPVRGPVKVYVDGTYVTTVNPYLAWARNRNIVWEAHWAAAGPHTVKLVAAGTARRPRVDLDAFVILK